MINLKLLHNYLSWMAYYHSHYEPTVTTYPFSYSDILKINTILDKDPM